jgi:hypothetical protein
MMIWTTFLYLVLSSVFKYIHREVIIVYIGTFEHQCACGHIKFEASKFPTDLSELGITGLPV